MDQFPEKTCDTQDVSASTENLLNTNTTYLVDLDKNKDLLEFQTNLFY